jgi:hypothetical protein
MSDSISWTLGIALPAAIINSVFIYFARPDLGFLFLIGITLVLVAVISLLAILALRASVFTVSSDGVRGWPSTGIRSITVSWSAIQRVNRVLAGGDILCFRVEGENVKNSCSVPMVIAQMPEYQAAVQQFVEPNHCLLKALEAVVVNQPAG